MSEMKSHKKCSKPIDMPSKNAMRSLSPKGQRITTVTSTEDLMAPIRRMSMDLESRVEVMKSEVVGKIDQEMNDSHNTREFISQKYNELCDKIKSLAGLETTVCSFRGEVRALERCIDQLTLRVEYLEKRHRPGVAGVISKIKNDSVVPEPNLA